MSSWIPENFECVCLKFSLFQSKKILVKKRSLGCMFAKHNQNFQLGCIPKQTTGCQVPGAHPCLPVVEEGHQLRGLQREKAVNFSRQGEVWRGCWFRVRYAVCLIMTHQISSRYLSESQVFDHFLFFDLDWLKSKAMFSLS